MDGLQMRCMLLNLPNPPGRNIYREYAGGFGVSGPWSNSTLLPIYLLYATSAAKQTGWEYDILDAQAMKYSSAKVISAVEKNRCTLKCLSNEVITMKKESRKEE